MKAIKFILAICACIIISDNAFAQVTYNPTVQSQNNSCTIEKVEMIGDEMIVSLKIPTYYKSAAISDGTICMPSTDFWHDYYNKMLILDWKYCLSLTGSGNVELYESTLRTIKKKREQAKVLTFLIKDVEGRQLSTYYRLNRDTEYSIWKLRFDRPINGVERISIRECSKGGWEWIGIRINNPCPKVERVCQDKNEIKELINSSDDPICGIYESLGENKLTLACVKHNGDYKLLFISEILHPEFVEMFGNLQNWEIGEVKMKLTPTATNGLFKAYYGGEQKIYRDKYASFSNGIMKIYEDKETEEFIKLYPTNTTETVIGKSSKWSGSGFAIGRNYIVTNHHVIDGAKTISIKGINGNFDNQYTAEVIASDRNNDLALLKITDSRFTAFTNIPYAAKTTLSDVGEEIFVLGYPLTSTMGEEIKLTTGVISSRSGFQGDIASYQISAPVQPGNSGGPLFDSKGNLIGVVSAKHTQAENAGYAVKTSYLKILLDNAVGDMALPSNNQINNLPLTEKIKKVKNYVFLIDCSK